MSASWHRCLLLIRGGIGIDDVHRTSSRRRWAIMLGVDIIIEATTTRLRWWTMGISRGQLHSHSVELAAAVRSCCAVRWQLAGVALLFAFEQNTVGATWRKNLSDSRWRILAIVYIKVTVPM